MCKDAGVVVEFLSPYSPEFNPIEEYFGVLKRFIKNWYENEDFIKREFKMYLEWTKQLIYAGIGSDPEALLTIPASLGSRLPELPTTTASPRPSSARVPPWASIRDHDQAPRLDKLQGAVQGVAASRCPAN
ncbi:hypothetical protein Purlil1_12524 [Purpureocillium lilacinum]|uniref:Tc1-like transposase DDE domain-containing protein n=1 Tax=Purpureocillium lilacinum TaxID=33203 RepID=A0ABR0BHR4_PURLI|nr:hypothetical protein Purlil1_12524 [Purpureocillium lilacinum]